MPVVPSAPTRVVTKGVRVTVNRNTRFTAVNSQSNRTMARSADRCAIQKTPTMAKLTVKEVNDAIGRRLRTDEIRIVAVAQNCEELKRKLTGNLFAAMITTLRAYAKGQSSGKENTE